jgi:hypothetical protein
VDELGQGADRGDQRDHPERHRLEHGHREALGRARQHEQRGPAQQLVALGVVEPPAHLDDVRDPRGVHGGTHLVDLPVTGGDETEPTTRGGREPGARLDHVVDALAGPEPAEEERDHLPVVDPPRERLRPLDGVRERDDVVVGHAEAGAVGPAQGLREHDEPVRTQEGAHDAARGPGEPVEPVEELRTVHVHHHRPAAGPGQQPEQALAQHRRALRDVHVRHAGRATTIRRPARAVPPAIAHSRARTGPSRWVVTTSRSASAEACCSSTNWTLPMPPRASARGPTTSTAGRAPTATASGCSARGTGYRGGGTWTSVTGGLLCVSRVIRPLTA